MDSYVNGSTGPLRVRVYDGEGTPILMVHGLGGSAVNWDAVGPALGDLGHSVALDLPGFGLSPPGPDWELRTHASAVRSIIRQLGAPAVLIGNSMGGLVSEMVAVAAPETVAALVLVAPATPPILPDPRLHWPTARRLALQAAPFVGHAVSEYMLRRYEPEELVRLSLEMIAHDAARVPPDVVAALIDVARARAFLPWTAQAVPRSGRSIARTFARRKRIIAMVCEIAAPTLVIQGLADHIVSPTSVEWLCSLRPDWDLVQMDETGHVPQLDAPVRFLGVVIPWLKKTLGRNITATTSL